MLGVTFGALAGADGWGTLAPVVASATVFSGSAQFVLVTALAGGGAAWIKTSRRARLSALTSGVIAALLLLVLPTGLALLGGSAAALLGLLPKRTPPPC